MAKKYLAFNVKVAGCELRVASCDFKEINLRLASSFYQVVKGNLFWECAAIGL